MSQAGTVLDLIQARRRDDAVELVRSAARDAGLAAAAKLLAEVQRKVGDLWQQNELTVADEHAATAIIDLALAAACLEAKRRPHAPEGAVVVTCAEEEWHVMPARMFAEQLRAAGWDVVFLGASTPAEHLQRFVAAEPPAAVAVSCTVPIHLHGARRAISACHAAGVPVLAGGAAFGTAPNRAAAIGADAWASTLDGAVATLSKWVSNKPPLAAPLVDDAPALAAGAERPLIVERAMSALASRFPPLADYTSWQLARTREDLDYILRFVEASLLTGDDSIITGFASWLTSVLAARGLPDSIVALGIDVLHECLPEDRNEVDRLLTAMKAASAAEQNSSRAGSAQPPGVPAAPGNHADHTRRSRPAYRRPARHPARNRTALMLAAGPASARASADDLDPRPVARRALALPAGPPHGERAACLRVRRRLGGKRGLAHASLADEENDPARTGDSGINS